MVRIDSQESNGGSRPRKAKGAAPFPLSATRREKRRRACPIEAQGSCARKAPTRRAKGHCHCSTEAERSNPRKAPLSPASGRLAWTREGSTSPQPQAGRAERLNSRRRRSTGRAIRAERPSRVCSRVSHGATLDARSTGPAGANGDARVLPIRFNAAAFHEQRHCLQPRATGLEASVPMERSTSCMTSILGRVERGPSRSKSSCFFQRTHATRTGGSDYFEQTPADVGEREWGSGEKHGALKNNSPIRLDGGRVCKDTEARDNRPVHCLKQAFDGGTHPCRHSMNSLIPTTND
jgi:hypothetical protein